MHSVAKVFLFYKTITDWPNFCKRQTCSHYFLPLKYLLTKANQYFVTRGLIGQLHPVNFFTQFHLEADSIFALAFADKMTKKRNCCQETTGTQVPPNSLPVPSLPEQPLSVTNKSCSDRK